MAPAPTVHPWAPLRRQPTALQLMEPVRPQARQKADSQPTTHDEHPTALQPMVPALLQVHQQAPPAAIRHGE